MAYSYNSDCEALKFKEKTLETVEVLEKIDIADETTTFSYRA